MAPYLFLLYFTKITYKKHSLFFKESVKTKLLITIEFYHDKFNFKFQKIELKNDTLKIDKRIENLFLLSNCKHFIVIPSTFNWWGAWLSENKDKIILRPSNKFFSKFYINNLDFWPDEWIKISRYLFVI